jgi:hypothetical protein
MIDVRFPADFVCLTPDSRRATDVVPTAAFDPTTTSAALASDATLDAPVSPHASVSRIKAPSAVWGARSVGEKALSGH